MFEVILNGISGLSYQNGLNVCHAKMDFKSGILLK